MLLMPNMNLHCSDKFDNIYLGSRAREGRTVMKYREVQSTALCVRSLAG